MLEKDKIKEVLDILEKTYPEAECALHHKNVFQLIVAVALSAQTTDKSVNVVTPSLFERYPDAEALAAADVEEVSEYIKRIGMYKTKARNIVGMAQKLVSEYGGQVPEDYDALVSLPGVGRKTANVIHVFYLVFLHHCFCFFLNVHLQRTIFDAVHFLQIGYFYHLISSIS